MTLFNSQLQMLIAAKMWWWTVEAVEVFFFFLLISFWRTTFCVRNIWWHLCHAKGLVSTTGTLWWGYERMGRWAAWRVSRSKIRRYAMHGSIKSTYTFFFSRREFWLVKVSSEWLKLFVIYIVCHVLYRRFSYQLNQDIRLYVTNHLFQDAYIQMNIHQPVQGSVRISM